MPVCPLPLTRELTASVALFMDFKKTRDAIIHARIINVTVGIGRGTKQRGNSSTDVLLNIEALTAFYDHVVALKDELRSGAALLESAIMLKQSNPDDPDRSQFERSISGAARSIPGASQPSAKNEVTSKIPG